MISDNAGGFLLMSEMLHSMLMSSNAFKLFVCQKRCIWLWYDQMHWRNCRKFCQWWLHLMLMPSNASTIFFVDDVKDDAASDANVIKCIDDFVCVRGNADKLSDWWCQRWLHSMLMLSNALIILANVKGDTDKFVCCQNSSNK